MDTLLEQNLFCARTADISDVTEEVLVATKRLLSTVVYDVEV